MSDLLGYRCVTTSISIRICLRLVARSLDKPKATSLYARSLGVRTPSQNLHADLAWGAEDRCLVVWQVDSHGGVVSGSSTELCVFVPASQDWVDLSSDPISDTWVEYLAESATLIPEGLLFRAKTP